MARNVSLLQLIEAFRAEARQSTQLSVGTDSLPHVKQLLRRTQRLLYEKHFWPFLSMFPTKAVVAGDRYYDAPDDLNIDRIVEAVIIHGDEPLPIIRGIGFNEYALYDPTEDERSSPVEKWDLRWTGDATQLEVWPLPSANQTLQFKCMRPLRALTDDDDLCDLDEDLIVLFAVAEELANQKSRDAELKMKMAQGHLLALQANAQAGAPITQMGLGGGTGRVRANVRVT